MGLERDLLMSSERFSLVGTSPLVMDLGEPLGGRWNRRKDNALREQDVVAITITVDSAVDSSGALSPHLHDLVGFMPWLFRSQGTPVLTGPSYGLAHIREEG